MLLYWSTAVRELTFWDSLILRSQTGSGLCPCEWTAGGLELSVYYEETQVVTGVFIHVTWWLLCNVAFHMISHANLGEEFSFYNAFNGMNLCVLRYSVTFTKRVVNPKFLCYTSSTVTGHPMIMWHQPMYHPCSFISSRNSRIVAWNVRKCTWSSIKITRGQRKMHS